MLIDNFETWGNTFMKMELKRWLFSAMFLAIGIILPFFTAQIKEIGDTLLPLHLPVMLCGLVCGWKYGLAVGFVLPLFRAFLFSMPPIYPNAVWMAFELATYGFIIGFLYFRFSKRTVGYLYFCLITAMLGGRFIWIIAKTVLLDLGWEIIKIQALFIESILDSVPGVIAQFIIIPLVMNVVNRIEKQKR